MTEKDTYWQKNIDLYLTSGQTQKGFCEHNSLSKDRFKYHYRRLHLKTINNKSIRKKKQKRLPLTPVNLIADSTNKTQPPSTNGLCTIHLPNGTKINLNDAQLVERYLSRSMRLC